MKNEPIPSTALLVLLALAAACGGGFSPRELPVPLPLRESLTDFRTGSLQDPSAFDVVIGQTVRTDQIPGWDFLFFITEDGQPQFRPRGEFLDAGPSSGLQRVDQPFDSLTMVPDTGYVREEPVPAEVEAVYALASRRSAATGCRQFGKLEVVDIDLETGEITFDFVVNPNCNDRNVQPSGFGVGSSG